MKKWFNIVALIVIWIFASIMTSVYFFYWFYDTAVVPITFTQYWSKYVHFSSILDPSVFIISLVFSIIILALLLTLTMFVKWISKKNSNES